MKNTFVHSVLGAAIVASASSLPMQAKSESFDETARIITERVITCAPYLRDVISYRAWQVLMATGKAWVDDIVRWTTYKTPYDNDIEVTYNAIGNPDIRPSHMIPEKRRASFMEAPTDEKKYILQSTPCEELWDAVLPWSTEVIVQKMQNLDASRFVVINPEKDQRNFIETNKNSPNLKIQELIKDQ